MFTLLTVKFERFSAFIEEEEELYFILANGQYWIQ